MWPGMEMDMLFSKIEAIRDIIRIAYGTEGENRTRLFETARSMLAELAGKLEEKAPEQDDD